MTASFPFGNDWEDRDMWLGGPNARSRRYLVSYEGNFSLFCGYHSFIFFGLDSLAIGIVSLTGCGPSIGVPVGKILGYGADAVTARRIEKMDDATGKIKSIDGHLDLQSAQAGYDSGMELLAKMRQGVPQQISAHKPFSFNELNGKPGAVAGVEVEIVGSASLYFIEASENFLGDLIFGQDAIANAGGGLVSASIGGLAGVWATDRLFNLYTELGRFTDEACRRENQAPAYAQPYRHLLGVHPAIQDLPPFGCYLPDVEFDPLAAFR